MKASEQTPLPPLDSETTQDRHPLERWFWEGWMRKNLDIAEEVFSPDVVVHLSVGDVHGIDTLKNGACEIHKLEGLSGDVETTGSGDEWAAMYVYRGHHIRPYFGIEPTGKVIEAKGVVTVRMSEGKIAEVWQTCTSSYLDPGGMGNTTLDAHAMMNWAISWALTPREAMVADLAMQGFSDKQIGEELQLATASVNKYMQRILQKAGANSRAELAERSGMISVG